MLRLGSSERMMHRIETVGLVIPFEQREINNPERSEHMRIAEPEPVAHLDTENSEHGLRLALRTAEHEQHVPGLCSGLFSDSLQFLRCIELVDG